MGEICAGLPAAANCCSTGAIDSADSHICAVVKNHYNPQDGRGRLFGTPNLQNFF